MKLKDLETRAAALMDEAVQQGADQAEVVASHRTVSRITFEKNDFQLASTNTMLTLGLEVHKDGRKGSAVTNETEPGQLGDAAGKALTLASFSIPDEHLCFAGPQEPEELPGRYDPELAELPADELRGFAERFLEAGRHPKLSLDGADMELASGQRVVVNSQGLAVRDRRTRLEWSLMGMGKTEDEVTSFDWVSDGSFAWKGAPERSLDTARGLQDKVLACFGPRKGTSYKGRVLLSPAVVGELLLHPLEFHISGRQIMDGKSRWEKQLGESVASEIFTLVDDPFDLGLDGAKPFDAEGVATRPTPIIEKGLLKAHIDSTYTARRRGTESTGHAGGLHACRIEPGGSKLADLRAMADPLVVVERFSGNLDPVTGDFSGVAKNSHWYEGGERRHPLTETMIAGNFFEMLKDIVALGDEAVNYSSSYRSPWILVDGISVTAG